MSAVAFFASAAVLILATWLLVWWILAKWDREDEERTE